MSNLFNLFLNNLSPILLIAGGGYVLGKRFRIDPRTFSQVVFYFFSPCLVFNSLAKNQLSESDFLRVAGFAVAVVVLIGYFCDLFLADQHCGRGDRLDG